MADKLTLIELHLHADGNEFENEMEFSSDIGDILRRRLGFGGSDDSESTTFGTESDDAETSSLTSSDATVDGGDTVQIGEDESDEGAAVVEIDSDADFDEGADIDEDTDFDGNTDFGDETEDDDSGGRSWGRTLLVFVLLVGLALLARWYLGGDDIEDEFEEL